jgi:hypothetical protein
MAKLTTKRRNSLPSSKFGLPGERKYPIDSRGRAINAKARATQMADKGKLSAPQKARIDSKANRYLESHK